MSQSVVESFNEAWSASMDITLSEQRSGAQFKITSCKTSSQYKIQEL